jgi:hypothetical protein
VWSYLAIDPENRLVGRNLEKDWNDKLAAVEQLEREQAAVMARTMPPLNTTERQHILDLAEDLPALWHAPSTTAAERKQLLRFLIQDVTLTKRDRVIALAIRWQTQACTLIEVPRPLRSCDVRRTPAAVVERVRALANAHSDSQIATRLNAEGCTSGTGRPFTAARVQWIRYAHTIASGCPEGPGRVVTNQRGDGRYSTRAVAELLNVNISTVMDWCRAGRLDGIQSKPHGPWWIVLTPVTIAELRKPVRQRWGQRSSP